MNYRPIRIALTLLAPVALLACADSQQQFGDAYLLHDGASLQDSGVVIDNGPEIDLQIPVDAAPDAAPCKLLSPYSTKDKPCNDCAEQNCCEEINACFAAPQCDDLYVNCILACALLPDNADAGVPDCVAKCGTDYPDGKTGYLKAIGCADTKCPAECDG